MRTFFLRNDNFLRRDNGRNLSAWRQCTICRDAAATQLLQLRAQLSRIRAETAAPVRRTDQPPTNDLRRAVRPEEIFLVTTFINGQHLCDQVLAKLRAALQ